jgi:nucleoid-associated protein YgaU
MSIFDIVNPVEKAKAALAEAQKAKADQYAKGAIDAMNVALAQHKLAEVQKAMDAATKAAADAAAEAAKWKQQEETIEDALEHAGISGVDVQIDAKGYAKVLGSVTSEADRDTAVAMVEQFPVSGMEVALDIVPPAPVEASASAVASASGPVNYKVKAGESWWGIAARTYGDGTLWKALKAANGNPRMIHPGTEIVLPQKDALKA